MEDEPLLSNERRALVNDDDKSTSYRNDARKNPTRTENLFTGHLCLAVAACTLGSSFQFGYNTGIVNSPIQSFTGHLALAIAACTLGSSFQYGFNTGIVNAPIQTLQDFYKSTYFHRHDTEMPSHLLTLLWAITVSIYCIGGMLGGVSAGYWADVYGRRTLLLANNIILVYGLIWEIAAKYLKSYELLIVGRFVIGINAGLNTGTVPLYLSEISPIRLRGLTGTFNQLCITFGVFMSEIIGLSAVFGTTDKWQYAFGFPIIMSAFQLITLSFCPESPRYLFISKHQEEAAESALLWLRQTNDVSDEMNEMLTERDKTIHMKKFSVKDLICSPALRSPLVICVVMHLSQQYSGINAVIYYSTDIFKNSANLTQANAQYATLATGAVNVAMTFVSAMTMDRLGRRTLHLTGLGGMFFTTILLTLSIIFQAHVSWFKYVAVAAVIVYIIFFAAGPGAIPWFFTAELFAQGPRGAAVGIGTMVNWLANFSVGLLFPILKGPHALTSKYVFIPFIVVLGLTWLFTYFKVPETKGRTLDDITMSFREGDYMAKARLSIAAQGRIR